MWCLSGRDASTGFWSPWEKLPPAEIGQTLKVREGPSWGFHSSKNIHETLKLFLCGQKNVFKNELEIGSTLDPTVHSPALSFSETIGWEEIHRVGRNSNRMGDSGILIKVILSFETVAKHKSVLCTKFKISFETLKHKSVFVFTNLFPQCNSLEFKSTNCVDLIALHIECFSLWFSRSFSSPKCRRNTYKICWALSWSDFYCHQFLVNFITELEQNLNL